MPKQPPKPAADAPHDAPPDVPSSALVRAPSSDESNALAVLAAAGFGAGDDALDDGLTEVSVTDLKTPYKLFNLKAADGVARISQDQFLDTIDRVPVDRLRLVLLDMHKTNQWATYNSRENRNETQCESYDRVTGIYHAQGDRERPCKGCPDTVWRTVKDDKGDTRRTVNCGEVWNVAAFDLDSQRVCLIKFKKTSLDAIRGYVQAHHIERLPGKGVRRGNIPLCAYQVAVHLEMTKGGTHAVPKLERGAMLSAADMRVMHETAQGVRETFAARMQAADESARGVGDDGSGGGGDTSFDTHAMDAANNTERGSEAFVE